MRTCIEGYKKLNAVAILFSELIGLLLSLATINKGLQAGH